jgi:LuxR family quorum-sensing system transcriptional regulator CciR
LFFARSVSYAAPWTKLSQAAGFRDTHMNVLSLAADFGLHSGVCIGTHCLDGSLRIVSFASAKRRALSDKVLRSVTEIGHGLGKSMAPLAEDASDEARVLTEREVECLTWCALGKTSGDVSTILEISCNTVEYHLKGAMQKLRTNSRAIVKAMRMGLISL